MHPNAAADLTGGGWLGAKARDLASQAACKSTVAAHWHALYPGSQDSQVTIWKLKKPACHGKTVFTNQTREYVTALAAASPVCSLLGLNSSSFL